MGRTCLMGMARPQPTFSPSCFLSSSVCTFSLSLSLSLFLGCKYTTQDSTSTQVDPTHHTTQAVSTHNTKGDNSSPSEIYAFVFLTMHKPDNTLCAQNFFFYFFSFNFCKNALFPSKHFAKTFECQTVWISDEAPRFVGPYQDPNCLQRSSTIFKIFR